MKYGLFIRRLIFVIPFQNIKCMEAFDLVPFLLGLCMEVE